MTRVVKFDEKAQSAIQAAEKEKIEAFTKGTQFPELITEHEHEAFWYQDKTNRLKRQTFSLEFLKRFITNELDLDYYVEKMIDRMEDRINAAPTDEEDNDDEELE